MNGIINIDKPAGITSLDVVARLRRVTGERKAGHAGTLDPMATGVLPVFFGRATKAIGLLPVQDKRYTASFRLGIRTDTGDITGNVLKTKNVCFKWNKVNETVMNFVGTQKQIPPMYSALKVDGRRLYELARQGIEVDRQAREITIYKIRLLPAEIAMGEYTIDVECSKGTYIRTLCEDIGDRLGCGATMTALRRTSAAGFEISNSMTIEQVAKLSEQGNLSEIIQNVEDVFSYLPEIWVTAKQAVRFLNGGALDFERLQKTPQNRFVRIKSDGYGFLGLGEADHDIQQVKVKCLFTER